MQSSKDAELFKNVNTVIPPQHEKLVPGWIPPTPPGIYRNLVAILAPVTLEDGYKAHMWVLDYLDTDTAVFASEDHEFEVMWPWVLGYLPQSKDWEAIGIPPLS